MSKERKSNLIFAIILFIVIGAISYLIALA
jgi:hypothetical protein